MKPWWQSDRTGAISFAICAAVVWIAVLTKPQPWSEGGWNVFGAGMLTAGAILFWLRYRREVRERETR